MPSVVEMKEEVLKLMKLKYVAAELPDKVTDAQIAAAYYLRQQDATAVRGVCSSMKLTVSFREAGKYTLERIAAGHPCKGHKIGDKSIKKKDAAYTYAIDQAAFKKYQGLVGVPNGSNLKGIWTLEGGKAVPKLMADFQDSDIPNGITGDYDMHDLLNAKGRIMGGTPDEERVIDALNAAMLKVDPAREQRVKAEGKKRLRDSNYALIRHGAQSSYLSYLMGKGKGEIKAGKVTLPDGGIPDQDKIANISAGICLFDPKGAAYISTTVGSIYKYYEKNDLLGEIPFYYFFQDLNATHGDKLAPFAALITKYMTLPS